jgi:hypothetical protein
LPGERTSGPQLTLLMGPPSSPVATRQRASGEDRRLGLVDQRAALGQPLGGRRVRGQPGEAVGAAAERALLADQPRALGGDVLGLLACHLGFVLVLGVEDARQDGPQRGDGAGAPAMPSAQRIRSNGHGSRRS